MSQTYMRTVNTNLYVIDDTTVHDIQCNAIDGIGATRSVTEIQTLQQESAMMVAGSMQPGSSSFTIYLHNSDAQLALYDLYKSAKTVTFVVGLQDGTAAPVDADDLDQLERSWIRYQGFITDFPFNFAVNSAVECTITVQLQEAPDYFPKTAA